MQYMRELQKTAVYSILGAPLHITIIEDTAHS